MNGKYNLMKSMAYEVYQTKESCCVDVGGYNGETHELFYVKGNRNDIIITEVM